MATYDISVLDENNQVVKMENGNFKISLNLGTELLSKFKNFKVVYIDDNGNSPSALLQGLDFSSYPVPRTFTLGISLTL